MLVCDGGKDFVCIRLELVSVGVLGNFLNYYYVLLTDAYDIILGFVGNERGDTWSVVTCRSYM